MTIKLILKVHKGKQWVFFRTPKDWKERERERKKKMFCYSSNTARKKIAVHIKKR